MSLVRVKIIAQKVKTWIEIIQYMWLTILNDCNFTQIYLFPIPCSESLFSTDCIPEEDCTYATGFWAILGLYGLLYVCFFIFEMEWKLVVRDFSRWILLRLNIKTQKEFDEADEEESRGKPVISQKHFNKQTDTTENIFLH